MSNISGLQELLVKLRKIANDESVMRGIEKACIRVETDAKINCPVDDGNLRMSITHETDQSELQGVVGTNVEYAPYVEFGTGIYATEGGGRATPWSYQDAEGKWHTTVGQMPQPFLYPAFESNKRKIKEDIAESVKEELRRLGR